MPQPARGSEGASQLEPVPKQGPLSTRVRSTNYPWSELVHQHPSRSGTYVYFRPERYVYPFSGRGVNNRGLLYQEKKRGFSAFCLRKPKRDVKKKKGCQPYPPPVSRDTTHRVCSFMHFACRVICLSQTPQHTLFGLPLISVEQS